MFNKNNRFVEKWARKTQRELYANFEKNMWTADSIKDYSDSRGETICNILAETPINESIPILSQYRESLQSERRVRERSYKLAHAPKLINEEANLLGRVMQEGSKKNSINK